MLANNWLALIITFSLAVLWLRINDYAASKGWLESHLSRKFVHIGTGPLFVLCWLLFDTSPSARYLAAIVPLIITIQFALTGLGILKDEATVQALSRTGDPREILRGPLYYGIVFVVVTVVFWIDHPAGILALMLMCGGDGLADILGRRWGKQKLPWAPEKSWWGSFGMLIGGWGLSILVLAVFLSQGVFAGELSNYYLPTLLIAMLGTMLESLPFKDIDNITVTLGAIILGLALL